MKLDIWDENKRRRILQQRLSDAKKARKAKEERWEYIESSLKPVFGADEFHGLTVTPDVTHDVNSAYPEVGSNFLMKNLRFLHSQMSSNPPTCSPKPTSYDPADRDAADAADRISRWALRAYEVHEHLDRRNLHTLTYGSGFTKKVWDAEQGEFLSIDEEGNAVMEGDFKLTVPNIRDIYLDADARVWGDVRFVFERVRIPWSEAVHKWPEQVEELKKWRSKGGEGASMEMSFEGSKPERANYDVVTLWEYYETGLASNGYQGRYCLMTEDAVEIEEMRVSPESYKPIAITREDMELRIKEGRIPPTRAVLPYDILTDIDDLNSPWGISTLEFAAPLQEHLNRLDSAILQTADANGVPRLVLPESAEIAKDSITSVAYDIIKYAGNIPPDIMSAAPLSQVVTYLRQQLKNDIDEMMGVNQAMFGVQQREQSGFSQSYSVNQGNLIRQRLFNKYVRNTERLYTRILLIIANTWTTPRVVKVIGDENVAEVRSFKGANISYGYDVVPEFSSSLSLDPMTRRTEIINMWPILKEAGLDQRKLIAMLKLSELGNAYDLTKIAENRMKSYINQIIATGIQQQPREKENHAEMLAYASEYVMLEAFAVLPEPIKRLIEEHMTLRAELLQAQMAPAPGGEEAMPGEAPGELELPPAGPPVGLL